ncbi:MAG: hypothetical protein M3N57_07405 [Actinomycetota bacterium]|nr:hypothetical protein [Actinomycetota bacterium]
MDGTPCRAIRKAVELSLSDPWELAEHAGSDRIRGTIIGAHTFGKGAEAEAIAVRLDYPLVWQGRSYPTVVMASRHGHGLLEALSDHFDVECNYVGVAMTLNSKAKP